MRVDLFAPKEAAAAATTSCDNTSRPGFQIDPPFAWETAHEAYFGAVASAQDLLEVTPVSTPIWWKQGQICLMADPANGRWGR